MLQLKNKMYYKTILFIDMFIMTNKIKFTFISAVLAVSIFTSNYTTQQAQANEQVKFSKQLLSEVVRHMENGLVVEPADIDALKNAICFLLSRDDLLETFSQNIHYEYKAGVMSWDSIASGLHIIYQEVKGV